MIAVSDPDVPANTWDLLRRTIDEAHTVREGSRPVKRSVAGYAIDQSRNGAGTPAGDPERMEQELGEERQPNVFEHRQDDDEEQPLPDGFMTVGIDGGYIRAAHKESCFEVLRIRADV